jgi:outer membrane protein assembly factor BamD
MHSRRWITATLIFAAVGLTSACSRGFRVTKFPTTDGLYNASMAEYNKKKWDNAITGFERLTLDLSARDSLLPLSHWYLAWAHDNKGEHILAATTFARLAESFPDDTLADDALFNAGKSYLTIWKNPELDPQYGTLAQVQFRQLLGVYPDTPLKEQTEKMLLSLDDRYASKDYLNGMYYVRRGAFDSAIIMFKDVVKNYPNTDHAKLALLRMVEVYRKPQMNYKEDAAETCATLRVAYATDPEVIKSCAVPADTAVKAKAPGNSATPVTRPPR